MKKLLATILALVMALGLCSVSWAEDVYTYENGELKKNGTAMTADEVKVFSGVNVIGFKNHDTRVYATVEEAYNELSSLTIGAVGKEGVVADDSKVTGLYSRIDDQYISIQWNIWGQQTLPTGYTLSLGREQGYLGSYYLRNLTVNGKNDAAQLTASTITVPWSYQYASDDIESVILSISNLKLLDSDTNGIQIARIGIGLGGTFTFNLNNCKVDGGFNMSGAYQGDSVWNISDNTFTCRTGGYPTYPLMLNGTAKSDAEKGRKTVLNFTGNTVSGYARGLNFNAYAGDLVVTGNEITPGAGYSAVQVSCCDTARIEGNKIHLNGGNVLTIHESFVNRDAEGPAEITVKNNTIDGSGYAVYDDVTASGKAYGEGETDANVKLVWQNNPCATMKTDTGIKGGAVKATAPAIAQIVSAGSTSSTGGYYYHPTTDTKADETKGSPKTFDAGVGIYAVTAVLSVTGMAWVGKKRH